MSIRLLKQLVRRLKRERFFSLVNILGLAMGMFCFMVTTLYVQDELTHDKWHSKVDRIYISHLKLKTSTGETLTHVPPFALREALSSESPGVEAVVNLSFPIKDKYRQGEEWFEVERLYYSEPSLFKVFDFSLKWGDVSSALSEPNTLILSSELADKHFGGSNPIGEFVEFENSGTFKVSGVLEPIPGNSHLQFDMLLAMNFNAAPYKWYKDSWGRAYGSNYVLITENYSLEQLKADAQMILKNRKRVGDANNINFSPFGDLYLNGETYGPETEMFGGQRDYLIIFSLVGSLLLLVACFNYINLNTAQAFSRTKSLAIRKVVGASKFRLLSILLSETAAIASIALMVAVIALELSLDTINLILRKRLDFAFLENPQLLLIPIGALILTVAISGIYPAIVASSFNTVSLLKGMMPHSKASIMRKSLLVFQFLICVGLLSGALIIRSQAKYMINLDLGYNVENVHNIKVFEGGFGGKYQELKTELERIPQLSGVSGSPLPKSGLGFIVPMDINGEKKQVHFRKGSADLDFTELLEIEILQGRGLNQVDQSELNEAVLINKTGVDELGLEDPIGKRISDRYTIVGVMNDFHYASAKSEIGPILVTADQSQITNLHFKFKEGQREEAMAAVQKVWSSFGTLQPFKTTEVATFYNDAYTREETLVRIFNWLTSMIIVIALLGLFSLTSFESQLREKELGIRKVLGATSLQLIRILGQKFLLLIITAMLIAIPICHYLINNWLNGFPYRMTNLLPQFSIAAGSVMILSLTILGIHGYLGSKRNPIEVLRTE